jgi:hypothetical protein
MKFEEYNFLGQVMDTTFVKASTHAPSSFSVKAKFIGEDKISLMYIAVVNMVSDQEALILKKRYEDESKQVLSNALKKIKADYKELSGKALKVKESDPQSSIEIINLNIHNGKRTAYFRSVMTVEVS